MFFHSISPFQAEGHLGIREVGRVATESEAILALGFALVFAGSADGIQHVEQVHVAGTRWSVIVIDPPGAATDGVAVFDFEAGGASCVADPAVPAAGAFVECFYVFHWESPWGVSCCAGNQSSEVSCQENQLRTLSPRYASWPGPILTFANSNASLPDTLTDDNPRFNVKAMGGLVSFHNL